MLKRWVALLVALFWLMILPLACNKRDKGGSDRVTDEACQPGAMRAASAAVEGSGALIVTDISGSMRGFAIPNSVRLYSVHDALERAVRNAVATVEPTTTIRRCFLGAQLDCDSQLPLQSMDRPATYSALESRLDLFFTPKQQQRTGRQEDPIDPYRLAVLITDGMQAQVPGSTAGEPCRAGADPDCIAYLLKQRVEKGYGIWMALLLLPFRGTHFAERPLDNSHWQQIQQHVATLAQDPYFQGVGFQVRKLSQTVSFTSFFFQGVKPALVLALSRDPQLGQNFIRRFGELIRQASVVQPSGAIYTIELAPLSVRPRQITKISLASTVPVKGVRPVIGSRKGNFYEYLTECDRDGAATFTVTSEEKEGTQMLPEGLHVNFSLEPVGKGNLPEGRLTIASAHEKSYDAQLSCKQIREGNYDRWFKLQANLKVDPNIASFWTALHANNMYEAPERLYGLRDVVQGVLEPVIQRSRITDCVHFRVERK